ncbi:MAG: LysR family transcriptional regulator [Amycolatopsis sp.]|uniref:LysR substrate-binding domain-containing protein n=1 Tax=Amycolatopsis sp. TaxID=37632 RepID=UPI0026179293|nr:LysR substrate-binding domain-containing protein [Amycolatopsis sp.]MCU1682759.1 LysR family transcriptional regulator [Amycolatopsis sp.]
MDFIQLEVFRAVAQELHFGRAAERLRLAQPYLSRTIRALEADLGAPLFDRTTRRVELTPAGRALMNPAAEILALSEQARAEVEAAYRGDSGRVRFSFAGPSSQSMVGLLARTVRERFGRINLVFRPGRYGPVVVRELLEKSTDLAIARFEHAPVGVASRLVARERGVLAVPSAHPLAGAAAVSFADLRGESFIALPEAAGSAVRAMFVAGCHAAGFAPNLVQTAPDSWTCVALVAAGVGLHVTTDSAVEHMALDSVQVVPFAEETTPISGYLLWRRDDSDPALAKVLVVSELVLPTVA